jgi:cellulose synthase/poly-beta-1,6-N-acetylglucosamine synthase-like glycosyltransferase
VSDSQLRPNVAIVCAVFNEERVLREKIENFFSLDYKNIHLYIGSDGSYDKTNDIINEYSTEQRIHAFFFPRRGKVHVINDLMNLASADILVFTDANTMFDKQAVEKLVNIFVQNCSVGAVCGRLILLDHSGVSGEGFYWRYETFIKRLENRVDCVIGANGAIYAVRKKLLKPLPTNTINDDFTISMNVLQQGFGVKYEESAIAYEEANHDHVEFKRHVRDGAGHYRAMAYFWRLLNPFKGKLFFLYVSHRVIRWIVPFLLLYVYSCAIFLATEKEMAIIVWPLFLFMINAIVGYCTKTRIKLFYIPFYFLYINFALLCGFFRNLLGIQKVTWNSTQR